MREELYTEIFNMEQRHWWFSARHQIILHLLERCRIVDGIAGNDRNIFLTGGKENDTTTWNIGPGTVGSSSGRPRPSACRSSPTQGTWIPISPESPSPPAAS
jgi:hypothetical protein